MKIVSLASATAALLAAAAIGCGSSSDSTSSSTPATTTGATAEQEIRALWTRSVDAFNSGDAEAVCRTMSAAAQQQTQDIARSMGMKSCEDVLKASMAQAGAHLSPKLTRLRIEGSRASAVDTEGGVNRFVKVDGKWMTDANADTEAVTAKRARRWPAAWCSVAPGASREEIRGAMGEPTANYEDQDQWSGFGLNLTAFYDPDLAAYQLDVSSGDVPCAQSRRR